MPVSQIFCEGGTEDPPDKLIIEAILRGLNVKTEAVGGKGSLSSLIHTLRRNTKTSKDTIVNKNSFALRDRDFDDLDLHVKGPLPWILKQDGKTQIGWKWSRNTLENYLIDPIVVAKSLKSRRPDDLAYRQALEEARDSLTYYTAARYTLSRCRESFKVFLENQWGRKYSLDGHKLPEVRTKQDCVNGIQAIVHEALAQRESFDFRAFFDEFLPSCSAAGERYSNFLVYFSGKDLLIAMESQLKGMGYESAKSFRKMIVKSISDSDDVWEWLDEWRELRNQVMNMP